MEAGGVICFELLGTLLGIGLAIAFMFRKSEWIFLALTSSALIMFLRPLFSSSDLSGSIPKLGGTVLGVLYIPWMMGFLILIRGLNRGIGLIIYLLAIIWADDILAYYTGRLLGKHPLCPRISPKKTVEGMMGGLIGSMLAAMVFGKLLAKEASIFTSAIIGLSVGSFGQLGDLCESVLKRWAGAKESGAILPGHGGLLDRIDGLIFSAPVFYFILSCGRFF